jgi:hypothetical protein
LKLTFGQLGDLEYMIVVRNHVDLIFSYYNFFSHVMKYYGLDVRTLNKVLKGGRADASFIIDNFRFGEVAEYASQFSDGLHVLFYEDFVDDKKGFLASVQERIGCEFEPASIPESRLNVSKDASSAKSSSFFDRFLRKKTYNLSESWKLEMIDVVKKILSQRLEEAGVNNRKKQADNSWLFVEYKTDKCCATMHFIIGGILLYENSY